jgi:hypothetical protein
MKSAFSGSICHAVLKRGFPLIAIIAMGCASASVAPQKSAEPTQASRPQRIYVRNFAVVAEDVKESHGLISQGERKFSSTPEQKRQMEIGHAAATELSGRLAKNLQDLGFTVDTQTGEVPVTGDALLIEGQFVNVDEGAAGRRVMIGFGVGQSTLDSQVQVYRNLGRRPPEAARFQYPRRQRQITRHCPDDGGRCSSNRRRDGRGCGGVRRYCGWQSIFGTRRLPGRQDSRPGQRLPLAVFREARLDQCRQGAIANGQPRTHT